MVKNIDCSSKRPRFTFQYPQVDSQVSIITVLGDMRPFMFWLSQEPDIHVAHRLTCRETHLRIV